MKGHRAPQGLTLPLLAVAIAANLGRPAPAQTSETPPVAPPSHVNDSDTPDPTPKGDSDALPMTADPATDAAVEEPHWAHPFDLRGKYMTGEWGGFRRDMEDAGIKLKIKLMNQYMVNMRGGKETKNGNDFAGSYEVDLYFDLEKMNIIDGAEFFIRGKGTWGGDDSDFDKEKIGALFKTNQDASAEEPIFVDKWWWTQHLWQDRIELRFGRLEPVKDLFDTSKIIGHEDKQFLNRALVRNATIPAAKALGMFAKWMITHTVYVQAAVLDAESRNRQTNFNTAFHDADEYRLYGEVGWKPTFQTERGPLWGHYRIGTWYDPTRKKQFFDTLSGRRAERFQSGDWGLFLGFDQMVWKENDDPADKQGLTIAARYGYARGEVNLVEHFWSAAVQYQGLIPTRDKDVIGFGVAQAILADEARRVRGRADRETVYELYYAIKIAPWLIISPDFQYIVNAGGDKDDRNAMVAGLRVMLSF